MRRLSCVVALCAPLISCTFASDLTERVLLSVTSEVSVDSVRVQAAQQGEVFFDAVVEADGRDLRTDPLGVDVGLVAEAGEGVDLQVSGHLDGQLVAIEHAAFSVPSGGVIDVHLSAISSACDADGDGLIDCEVAGCCDDDPVPEAFVDCVPDAGGAELCNDLDDDCDGQIDEGACEALPDAAPDVSLPDVAPDVPLTDLGPEEVIAPPDAVVDAEEEVVSPPDATVPDAIEVIDVVDVATEDIATPDVEDDVAEVFVCEPDCVGLACGDDGCGGSCGACIPGMKCSAYSGCIPLGTENVLRGDVTLDAVVDGADVTLLQAYLDGEVALDAFQLEAAQVDCVGEVDADDLALLGETIDGMAAQTVRYFETCAQYEICELDTCVADTLDGVVKGESGYCCLDLVFLNDAVLCDVAYDWDLSLTEFLFEAWTDGELGGPGQAPLNFGNQRVCDAGDVVAKCETSAEMAPLECGPGFPAWANLYEDTLAIVFAQGLSEGGFPTIDGKDEALVDKFYNAVGFGTAEPGPFHHSWLGSEVTVSFCPDGDHAFCGEVPQCAGIQCGPDPNGIPCGDCPGGWTCEESVCVICESDCAGKSCGSNGCDGICGICPEDEICTDGVCETCIPSCAGQDCGDDGCGGSCGECGEDASCAIWGQCVLSCAPGECVCVPACGDLGECLEQTCDDEITACFTTACNDLITCTEGCAGDQACQQDCLADASEEALEDLEALGSCATTGCDPAALATCDITCDGVDDDCDGVADDDFISEITTCGKGNCVAEGATTCVNTITVDDCVEGQAEEFDLCDGADEDCDGSVDEDFADKGLACDGDDADLCTDGVWVCQDLALVCDDSAAAVVESCNGADDDCNGLVDDVLAVDSCEVSNDLGLCTGLMVCVDQEMVCDAPTPEVEICDGQDNDCNGETDEGLGQVSCGVGACAHTAQNCVGGEAQTCDPNEGQIGEMCDGQDNDCDGETDESIVCTAAYVGIPAGTFTMGSPVTEPCRNPGENAHEVTLSRPFWLKTTEVTQAEWQQLMGNNPSHFSPGCDDCPVEQVNWYEALAYANALSASEGLAPCYELGDCTGTPGVDMVCSEVGVTASEGDVYACEGFRLPTEGEWERAVRANTETATYKGDLDPSLCQSGASDVLDAIAWYASNSGAQSRPVGTKEPNSWGLYDMIGNLWEWTWDSATGPVHDMAAVTDPAGEPGPSRVLRGGCWGNPANHCRSAARNPNPPEFRAFDAGFRVARSILYPDLLLDGDFDGVIDAFEPAGCLDTALGLDVTTEGCPVGDLSQDGCVTQGELDILTAVLNGVVDATPYIGGDCNLDANGDGFLVPLELIQGIGNLGSQPECTETVPVCDSVCAPLACVAPDCGADGCGGFCSNCNPGEFCISAGGDPPTWNCEVTTCSALRFDGIDDWVSLGNDPSLSLITDYTINLWALPDVAKPNNATLLSKVEDGSDKEFAVAITDENGPWRTAAFQIEKDSNDWFTTAEVGDAGWLMLTITVDPGLTARIYHDGELVTTAQVPAAADPTNLGVALGKIYGNYADENARFYRGHVRELSFHGRALSDGEIAQLADHTATPDAFSDLVAYWPLNDAHAGTVQDLSGHGHHGVVLGATHDAVVEGCLELVHGSDCQSIHAEHPDWPSGGYWIDPDGDGGDAPVLAGCDMEADGGASTVVSEGLDCADIHDAQPDWPDGFYVIDPDGDGGAVPFLVQCDMTTDGGGWTLVAISSDDGQDTWNWANRHYWDTDSTTLGSLEALDQDFKSSALHTVSMDDLLFVHAPSDDWASYHAVGSSSSLAEHIEGLDDGICYGSVADDGHPMTHGTLTPTGDLCSTNLYFNPQDQDGNLNMFGYSCDCDGCDQHAYGPVWSVGDNHGCPFDDPGQFGSLGPSAGGGVFAVEQPAVGFGHGLGLNTGAPGSGENHMTVFVRRAICGNGQTEGDEICDDSNLINGDGCSDQCELEVLDSCLSLLQVVPDLTDGVYTIDPDGDGGEAPIEVYCEMTTSGGGWTLVAVSSDDGQHTWTWQNRHHWDTTQNSFGSLDERHRDFKSAAYHRLPFSSLLFVHSTPADPDNKIWAQYAAGDGTEDLGAFIGSHPENSNYKDKPGIPMTAGNLTVTGLMCSTELYINPCGLDGGSNCTSDDNTYGPAWSLFHSSASSCPLDDPAMRGSLGPRSLSTTIEYYHNYAKDPPGVGFGVGIDINTGTLGSGENHMAIYVRAPYCGDGHADPGEVCDDGNDVEDDGCDTSCQLNAPLCEGELGEAPPGFVTIPAGTFTMGSPQTEPCRGEVETQHEVMLTRAFWLQTTEVTQQAWTTLMGNNPSQVNAGNPNHPVDTVNWYNALAYCNALSFSEQLPPCYTLSECEGAPWQTGYTCATVTTEGNPLDCEGYRLPTEAEWEYAARAGTTEATYNGPIDPAEAEGCEGPWSVLDAIAWYADNSDTSHETASKSANPWGLHDMLGNVWEWAWDSWDTTDYGPHGAVDPIAVGGDTRSARGGSWYSGAKYAQSSWRAAHDPATAEDHWGLRVARTVPECIDGDGDGVLLADNCPDDPNPDQVDADGDGHGAACDCDDAAPLVHPGAVEVCDGEDNNCDQQVDEENAQGCTTYLTDGDADGFGAGESECLCQAGPSHVVWDPVTGESDCCDLDEMAYPGQPAYFSVLNTCGDYDYDCDGLETQQFTQAGACPDIAEVSASGCPDFVTVGWLLGPDDGAPLPSCGQSALLLTDCQSNAVPEDGGGTALVCAPQTVFQTQSCR